MKSSRLRKGHSESIAQRSSGSISVLKVFLDLEWALAEQELLFTRPWFLVFNKVVLLANISAFVIVDAINLSILLISTYLSHGYCCSCLFQDRQRTFQCLPSTNALCSGGVKMCACFAGMWIIKSCYSTNVFVKQLPTGNLDRRSKNAHSMTQNVDRTFRYFPRIQ